ncbi:hypothetical protein MM236_19380 [Belliella sp. DSM 107340]|uniref:Uncharacterized protein n=1 Tax=Belliella calami TaxID=2923436 RepID=A0ABS9UVC0_9BACT|nr:hypothetical protein [Belliella calami]
MEEEGGIRDQKIRKLKNWKILGTGRLEGCNVGKLESWLAQAVIGLFED